jgi:hypothetical protein
VPEDLPFQEIDVTAWDVTDEETSGAEAKVWLEEPATKVRWLLKTVTVKNGHVHGEDWAEKAASHLAAMLGIPSASIELAAWHDLRGCISANLRPDQYQMQPGQALLETVDAPGYVHRDAGKDHPGHSLSNIKEALVGFGPPPGCDLPFDATAFDVFASYIMLDAWIANQDRHDHNWSILIPGTSGVSGPPLLSGSYDHASALAFGERDARLDQLIDSAGGVEGWCSKGRANRLEGRPMLVDAAKIALDMASTLAHEHWLSQLEEISSDDIRRILIRVPRMSDTARTFAGRVLEVNRRRVLDVCR